MSHDDQRGIFDGAPEPRRRRLSVQQAEAAAVKRRRRERRAIRRAALGNANCKLMLFVLDDLIESLPGWQMSFRALAREASMNLGTAYRVAGDLAEMGLISFTKIEGTDGDYLFRIHHCNVPDFVGRESDRQRRRTAPSKPISDPADDPFSEPESDEYDEPSFSQNEKQDSRHEKAVSHGAKMSGSLNKECERESENLKLTTHVQQGAQEAGDFFLPSELRDQTEKPEVARRVLRSATWVRQAWGHARDLLPDLTERDLRGFAVAAAWAARPSPRIRSPGALFVDLVQRRAWRLPAKRDGKPVTGHIPNRAEELARPLLVALGLESERRKAPDDDPDFEAAKELDRQTRALTERVAEGWSVR